MSSRLVLWLVAGCMMLFSSAPQVPDGHIGRAATKGEIRVRDIDVLADGTGLPPGQGDATTGRLVFVAKCARCHGPEGEGSDHYPRLVGGAGTLGTSAPVLTVGSYWPYATTLWDYIHRAMPYPQPGSLTARETYSVTAYILFKNGIVSEHQVVSAQTLPKLKMPNRAGFIVGEDSVP